MPFSNKEILINNMFFQKESFCLNKFKIKSSIYFEGFEIYNDHIFDFLNENKNEQKISLKLREINETFFVNNLTKITIDMKTKIKDLIKKIKYRRQVNTTLLNSNSSRSHAIFNIILEFSIKKDKTREKEEFFKSNRKPEKSILSLTPLQFTSYKENKQKSYFRFKKTITIVDLAGSERFKRTKNDNQGIREANSVNQSLSCLGRCLKALKSRQRVPYRESKLTQYLSKFFFRGNSISMIANINPCEDDFSETIRVLEYASTATKIKPIKSKLNKFRKKIKIRESFLRLNNDCSNSSTERRSISASKTLNNFNLEKSVNSKERSFQRNLEKLENSMIEKINKNKFDFKEIEQKVLREHESLNKKFESLKIKNKNKINLLKEKNQEMEKKINYLNSKLFEQNKMIQTVNHKLESLNKAKKSIQNHSSIVDTNCFVFGKKRNPDRNKQTKSNYENDNKIKDRKAHV